MDYLMLSVIRDEGEYISRVINSIINQDVRPKLWLIVDDGSTDKTKEILSKIKEKWIYVKTIKEKKVASFMNYSELLKLNSQLLYALAEKKKINWSATAILDGDSVPEKNYFGELLSKMKRNKSLGITSGYLIDAKSKKKDYNRKNRPWGAATLYSKKCLQEIEGFAHAFSHTSVEIILANYKKYETSQNLNTYFTHLRTISEKYGVYRGYYQNGIASRWLGIPVTFSIMKALKLGISRNPIKGIAYLLGYFRWKGNTCQNKIVQNAYKNKWKIWLRKTNI